MDNSTDSSNNVAILGYSLSGGGIVALLCGLVVALSKYYFKSSCAVANLPPGSPPGQVLPVTPVEVAEEVVKTVEDVAKVLSPGVVTRSKAS
jgi:hypothetical protein